MIEKFDLVIKLSIEYLFSSRQIKLQKLRQVFKKMVLRWLISNKSR